MKADTLDESPVSAGTGSSSSSSSNSCRRRLMTNLLLILTLIAIVVGGALGFGLRDHGFSRVEIGYIGFPGEIFQRALLMLVLPLIVTSLISSVANLDLSASKKMGLRGMVYYLSTTLLAVILGDILVLSIRPGLVGRDDAATNATVVNATKTGLEDVDPVDTILDLIRNVFPSNLVKATFESQATAYGVYNRTENGSIVSEKDPFIKTRDGMNVLGLVAFSLALGGVIAKMGEKGRPLADFFNAFNDATMRLVGIVMWYSPIGICFLIAKKVLEMDDLETMFSQLGLYMATVLSGLAIHGFVVLPLIYFVLTRKNPFMFMYNMLQAMLTAFGTSSSSVTLPVALQCLEERNNIDPRVSRFIMPIGATVNMHGTALYEAAAAIFIAQSKGVSDRLGVGDYIIISITATLAAIGAAGIPQAGLLTLVMVLTAVGLEPDVSLIITVDWFLDRFRTMINVWGDCIGAGIVQHLSKKELAEDSARRATSHQNGRVNNGYSEVESERL